MPNGMSQRAPKLLRLTDANMEDAPEAQHMESIRSAVNQLVDETEKARGRADKGIRLLESADVEQAEFDIQVPGPFTNITFAGTWADPVGAKTSVWMKHPNGLVELHVACTGGGATTVANLPSQLKPYDYVLGPTWDVTAGAAGMFQIDPSGVLTVNNTHEHFISVCYLALDSTPIPLSCWPKFVNTRFDRVSAVLIAQVSDAETTKTLPAGQVQHPTWELTKSNGQNCVKLLNIAGLPYNRKSRIRLLIVGG